MELKLQKHTVKIKGELGWYDWEEIKSVMSSGAKLDNSGLKGFDGTVLLTAKITLFEKAIEKITDEKGSEVQFSLDWVKSLSKSDGEKLDEAIAELDKKK